MLILLLITFGIIWWSWHQSSCRSSSSLEQTWDLGYICDHSHLDHRVILVIISWMIKEMITKSWPSGSQRPAPLPPLPHTHFLPPLSKWSLKPLSSCNTNTIHQYTNINASFKENTDTNTGIIINSESYKYKHQNSKKQKEQTSTTILLVVLQPEVVHLFTKWLKSL